MEKSNYQLTYAPTRFHRYIGSTRYRNEILDPYNNGNMTVLVAGEMVWRRELSVSRTALRSRSYRILTEISVGDPDPCKEDQKYIWI
ncbi:hypothetical protein NPIL_393871 [Nephila pilipes]|uniref:Uncharacterized protein n=1 Tax=Nephila pilipes TaxID=299642 RepID=A0A8X6QLB5_NEPPI|nr:hypothetical protein NPIL_393871 [Nephila pilipes]